MKGNKPYEDKLREVTIDFLEGKKTVNEIRAAFGLHPIDVDGADELWIRSKEHRQQPSRKPKVSIKAVYDDRQTLTQVIDKLDEATVGHPGMDFDIQLSYYGNTGRTSV